MVEFVKQDLSGARFEQVDFSRAWFHNVYFTGATLRGACYPPAGSYPVRRR